ncbi:MAG: carboxypeptidase-like regulatory domain-containing protein [Acidobacteria bacterium]|nr:carboxypeptidase-like regulatory domain-containing protein [Acidobacteriota bacterium]
MDIGAFEVQLAPTAASVSVSGRVTTAKGRGINKARVTMTDSNGATRTVLSNPFGYYSFDNVPAGETYFFSVSHKRYTFNQSTQVHLIVEDLNEMNFVADN